MLRVLLMLDYYSKLKSALSISYDATSSTDIVNLKWNIINILCYHKIRTFILHFMCEYIGIRLTSYGGNYWLLKFLKNCLVNWLTSYSSQLSLHVYSGGSRISKREVPLQHKRTARPYLHDI